MQKLKIKESTARGLPLVTIALTRKQDELEQALINRQRVVDEIEEPKHIFVPKFEILIEQLTKYPDF